MKPGSRYNVELMCDGFTHEQSEEWGTFYRYRFHDREGNHYLTSTSERRWERGLIYTGRASVKRFLGRTCVLTRCKLEPQRERALL